MWEYEKPKQEKILQSSPIVQRIRKRVKGAPASFDESDIYYDKNNGKYYNGMQQEASAQDVTVEKIEWDKCKRLSERAGRAEKNTILAEAKQGEQTKFINFADSGARILANEKYQFNTMPFNEGNELRVQPKVIRLYAEGYMAHALSLARTLTSSENYRKFYDLKDTADGEHPDADSGDVLIKATEYDSVENLANRYNNEIPELLIDKIPNISPEQIEKYQNDTKYAEQAKTAYQAGTENIPMQISDDFRVFYEAGLAAYFKRPSVIMKAAQTEARLEASFGTGDRKTPGDMSRPVSDRDIQRKYDIIQATFFWLPQGDNGQNFRALKNFMIYQRHKLKQGGKIRITLVGTQHKRAAHWNAKNGYSFVAGKLIDDTAIKEYYNITKIELENATQGKEKYSDRLNTLGLNPIEFTHTQTKEKKEVFSKGDLVIEATRKPAAAEPK